MSADGEAGEPAREPLITDVTGLTLAQLVGDQRAQLHDSVKRLLENIDHASQSISGWAAYNDQP